MQKNRQIGLLAAIMIAVVLAGAAAAAGARTSTAVRLTTLDTTLLVQINAVRQAHSLRRLKLSAALSVAAERHTLEMCRAGYFAHASLDHTLFWKRIERSYPAGGHRSWSVGENLLFVAPNVTATEAVSLWMNSPEHRANLLDPAWREVGIAARHSSSAPGVYNGEPVTVVTADFGVRS